MISKEEVWRIAVLARLELTKQEIETMQQDLSAILDYVDVLKKAPKATKEVVQQLSVDNATRKDEAGKNPSSLANNLIQAAPEKKDGYIKVKAIL